MNPEPVEIATTPVFEVYGPMAEHQGWDYIVYRSAQEALAAMQFDLDDLEDGDEVRIVFKKYTQAQLDEVIY